MSSPERESDPAKLLAKQRWAASLGPVLPKHVEAESPNAWGDSGDEVSDEEWLRDVPPHHG